MHVRNNDQKACHVEAELALKQDMIKSGMSAEEIERVLEASSLASKDSTS
jgi:hypothetical protein